MKILRWIAFLPIAFALISSAHIVVAVIAVKFNWFVILLLCAILGFPVGMATYLPVMVAPIRKAGATVVAALLILLEVFYLPTVWAEWPGKLLFWRILADLIMLQGAIVAGGMPDNPIEELKRKRLEGR